MPIVMPIVMPIIEHTTYTPPWVLKNRHLHTLYASLWRNVPEITYTRERIDTPDGDFLDLDWSKIGADKTIIVIHGMEGSSRSRYIPGIINAFNRRGWDGVAMNLRGCSGELNRLLRSYHSGATEDVDTVVRHVLQQNRYQQLALIGFSLGGNQTLKYLGEQGPCLPKEIIKAAAISTPCDLESSAWKLSERSNRLYLKNFLRNFQRKIRLKMQQMPGQISDQNYHEIKSFKDYDDRYTAPLHGFANAEDYWTRSSSKPFLPNICIPTLLLNALDDPFLREESYPYEEARNSDYLFLETPTFGGHNGFVTFTPEHEYWHETRITSFIITPQT